MGWDGTLRAWDPRGVDVAALASIPIIIFQGKDDTQVLAANTRRLAAQMRRRAAAFEYHEMIGDHWSIIGWTPQNIERALDFLERAGGPEGPPLQRGTDPQAGPPLRQTP